MKRPKQSSRFEVHCGKASEKKCTKTVKKKNFLILPTGGKDRLIPLVSTAEYLGAVISCSEFESQTVRSRIGKATHRWWQMQKLFCGRHGLTTAQRLQMWIVVIKPSLLYSLDCFPLPHTLLRQLQQLQTCMMNHVRAITRCPSHITHVSDVELLRQYHLQSVSGYLQDSILLQLRAYDSDVADRQWLTQIQQQLLEHQAGLQAVVRNIEPHPCPICGVYFDSRRSVKVHVARAHRTVTASEKHDVQADDEDALKERLVISSSGQTVARLPVPEDAVISIERPVENQVVHQSVTTLALNMDTRTGGSDDDAARVVLTQAAVEHRPTQFSREIHSRNGRPTCSGCGKDFKRWDHLRKHITKGYCKVFAPVSTSARSELQRDSEIGHREAVPMVSRPQVLEILHRRGFLGLINCRDVLQELRQRCALCHTWIAHTYMVKNHYRNTHYQFFMEHSKQCEKMCYEMGAAQVGEPCVYCESRVGERIHLRRCTPLWQCAILSVRCVNGSSAATGSPGVLRGCRNAIQSGSQAYIGDARQTSGTTQATARQGRKRQRVKGPPTGWYLQQRRRFQGLDDASKSPGETRRQHGIQALRQDTGLVFWARYDPPSIIPVLQASAKKWQGRAELAQGKLGNMPLREVLFVGILNTLVNTLTALDKDPEQIQKCQSSGWLNPEKCWVYQRWDRDQRVLVIDDSRTPKSSPQVLEDAQEMLRLAVMGHVIHRFHATKKLDMCSSGVLTLVMDLSVREPAGMDLHRLLMDYQG